MSDKRIALFGGCFSLALILGALGFQYLGDMPPCEMCHWQRWPHIAAALVGIVGGASARSGSQSAFWIAVCVLAFIVISGAIGAYQAGVEWQFLPGPAACTGPAVLLTGSLDLNHPVVRCDVAAWRLFGVSLAGYNALLSFAFAVAGGFLLARRRGQ